MKNLKIKIKSSLLLKIVRLKKEVRTYKERVVQDVLEKRKLIDKINLLEDDIRQLTLKLSKEDREVWLKEKGKINERPVSKKK